MTDSGAVRRRIAGLPRWVRLAFLLLVGVAAASQVAAFSARVSTSREGLIAASAKLLAARDSLGALESIRKGFEADSIHLDTALRRFFVGRTPAAEGAELASYVSDAARRAGYSIVSVDVQAAADSQSVLARPRVVIHGSADLSGLVQFLLLIELRERVARIVETRVEAPNVFAEPGAQESLRASVTVEGTALRRSRLPDSVFGLGQPHRGDAP